MRRLFPLLLLFGLVAAACGSAEQVASGNGQTGPVVKVFYSPS